MALTMVHLLAADKWAAGHPRFADSPEFFLGAISPDAIHVRDHGDKSRKDMFHLYNWRSPHPEPVIEYWNEHRAPFDIGYGVHVLTDAQWVPRYMKRLPGLLEPEGKLNIDQYYNDTFVTDFRLFHKIPRLTELLDMVEAAEPAADHPLLTADEFDQWRRMIVKAYRGECPKNGPVRFVDEAYVLEFVDDCVSMIDDVYARAGFPGDGNN